MINSTSNKQVKRVAALRSRPKSRKEEGLYVAEGLRMCRECSPAETEILYITEAFGADRENKRWLRDYKWEMVTDQVMNVMTDTRTPQGVLALVKQKEYSLRDVFPEGHKKCLLMILENIQDPGNLGTIIRAGEGAGVTGVVMSRDTADIYNPKVIRSTMGSIFRMPFVYTDDLAEACRDLKAQGVRLLAAHLKGMHNYDQEDYTDHVGFLIGNEANGLKEETAGLADSYIKIPMAGQVESLNAAVASSVLMFEAARQRRNKMPL